MSGSAMTAIDGFWDKSARFKFLVAQAYAREIIRDPTIIEAGRKHLMEFSASDPLQANAVCLWLRIIAVGPEEVVRHLLDRSPDGDYARETAPCFCVLPYEERLLMAAAASRPISNLEAVA